MAEGGILKTDDQIFLKFCSDLYTFEKSESTTSITIKFNSSKRDEYSKFREIIVKHYGEENFEHKGKNGMNGYQCKSKEENVTITLYLTRLKLFIQGGGYEQWFIGNGTFDHLVKQLYNEMIQPRYQLATPKENLAELTTYKTHAVTGSEPLVSVKEFKSNFAITGKYGDNDRPHTTILLYKYSSHATTRYQDYPENTWQRIDNDPKKKKKDYEGEHAESIMIKKLTKIQEHLKEQTDYKRGSYKGIHAIDVILSYSPCNEDPHCCSTKLCDFKIRLENDISSAADSSHSTTVETTDDASSLTQEMTNLNLGEEENKGAKIEINIQFSNFYRDSVPKNTEGLKKLLQNGIALDILTGNKWNDFYKAIGFELPAGREEREKEDEAKFEELSKQ